MKRTLSFQIFFLFAISYLTYGQDYTTYTNYYPLRGFEIVNPYYNNPAFITTEKDIQINLLGYGVEAYQGFLVNSIVNIPKLGGAVFVDYERDWYEDSKSWGFSVGYARGFMLNEDLNLNAGIIYKPYRIMDRNIDPQGNPYSEIVASNLYLGVSLEYKKFTFGLSTTAPLKSQSIVRSDDSGNEYADLHENSSNVISSSIRYFVNISDQVTIEPLLEFDYHYLESSEDKAKLYFGAVSEIGKTFGTGFTIGSLNSIHGSFKLGRSTELYLMFYSRIIENDFTYYLAQQGWNVIGQVRINLNYLKRKSNN